MIKGSEKRRAAHPIDSLLLDRWSPRAMSGTPLSEAELMTLFEAARWAPSASNVQPWRILYARRDSKQWPQFFDLLSEGNRPWAQHAGALLLFLSQNTTSTGKPVPTHSYDTGAAWQSLALQGTRLGLVVHGMAGFDHARARSELNVPENYAVEAMAAVGHAGDPANLPEPYRSREQPNDRRPLTETVKEGAFNF